jgi:hypothetical protein
MRLHSIDISTGPKSQQRCNPCLAQFPNQFDEFQRFCNDNNQTKLTVLILKYGTGGYNTLHQDLYGDISWVSANFDNMPITNERQQRY